MPLKLYKRGKVWWISGTHLKQSIRRSTGSAEKEVAEAILAKTIAEITSDHVYGPKATKTYGQAVTSYLRAGGDERFSGVNRDAPPSGLFAHFHSAKLRTSSRTIWTTQRASSTRWPLLRRAIVNATRRSLPSGTTP